MNVLIDTNVIIEFATEDDMAIFREIADTSFHVPEGVEYEVTHESQAELLKSEIDSGSIRRETLDELEDIVRYARLRKRNQEGECSCLVLAQRRKWSMATSETKRRFMKVAVGRLGADRIIRPSDLRKRRMHETKSERGIGPTT